MKTILGVVCLLLAGTLNSSRTQAGPLPTGEYQYDFPCNQGVWDLSGTSQYCEDSIGDEICLDLVMSQDASGKFTGTGTGFASIQGIDFDFDADVSGSVKSSGLTRTIALKVALTGTASYQGDVYNFSGNGTFQGGIDCQTGAANGTVKAKACVEGYGCSSAAGDATFEVPTGMDGSWTLTLNILDDQSITGTITLSNAELLQLLGKAKYSSKTDATAVSVKGDKLSPASKGSSVKLTINGSDFEVNTLSGKALGQKVQ